MKLIDKDSLVAELKKRIRDYWDDSENTTGIYPYALEEVIKYIDTLEVKEVDLDKLSISEQRIKYLIFEFLTGLQTFDTSLYSFADAYSKGIKDILKELGLKAQKGEYVYGYKMDW